MKHRRKNKKRKALTGPKASDISCKNNGSCPECRRNRTFANQRRLEAAAAELAQAAENSSDRLFDILDRNDPMEADLHLALKELKQCERAIKKYEAAKNSLTVKPSEKP